MLVSNFGVILFLSLESARVDIRYFDGINKYCIMFYVTGYLLVIKIIYSIVS